MPPVDPTQPADPPSQPIRDAAAPDDPPAGDAPDDAGTPIDSGAVGDPGSGRGVWLIDAAGRRCLDAIGSSAASSLGYAPPQVVAAIQQQAGHWIGDHPLAPHPIIERAADQIVQRSFAGQVAITASGSEAIEAAVRLVRWRGKGQRYKVITFAGGYHGATLGSLTASGDPQLHQFAGPLAAGFVYAPYGDAQAAAAAVDEATAAILVQPLQTHDRMRLPPEDFLPALRALADEHQLLLVVDETQLPVGLSGQWMAYQHAAIQPDLLALSAGLSGGLGCAAVVIGNGLADDLPPAEAWPVKSDPLAAAAILATLQAIEQDDLIERGRRTAALLGDALQALQEGNLVQAVTCHGLMIGVQLDADAGSIVSDCRRRGLLLGRSGDHTLRLQPPLVTSDAEAQQIAAILQQALEAAQSQPAES